MRGSQLPAPSPVWDRTTAQPVAVWLGSASLRPAPALLSGAGRLQAGPARRAATQAWRASGSRGVGKGGCRGLWGARSRCLLADPRCGTRAAPSPRDPALSAVFPGIAVPGSPARRRSRQ